MKQATDQNNHRIRLLAISGLKSWEVSDAYFNDLHNIHELEKKLGLHDVTTFKGRKLRRIWLARAKKANIDTHFATAEQRAALIIQIFLPHVSSVKHD
jgi:hypothetical protein